MSNVEGTTEKRTVEPQNNEPQNVEGWFRCAQSIFIKWKDFLQHHILGAAVYPRPQGKRFGRVHGAL
jgi:hypothetical protein